MKPQINTNYRHSIEYNKNLYLNSFNDFIDNDHYYENEIFIDSFDINQNKIILNLEHTYFNEYIYYTLHNNLLYDKSYSNITNDTTTTDKILFYIVFNDINFNEIDDSIVDNIRATASIYSFAQIQVVSNIFEFCSREFRENNKLASLNLNNVIVDYEFNIDNDDLSSIKYIITNKVSYLFRVSVEKQIPICLLKKSNYNFMKVIELYFNDVHDNNFKLYTNYAEFETFIEKGKVEDINFIKMKTYNELIKSKHFIMKLAHEKIGKDTPKNQFHLFGDIIMLHDIFMTPENRVYMNHTNDINSNSYIFTLNKFDTFHTTYKKSNHKQNIIIFDFDPIHIKNHKIMRYYFSNFNTKMNLYDFASINDICKKFEFDEVKPITYNPKGKIIVCLDNPLGHNYKNVENWRDLWQETFTHLESLNLIEQIQIKPYCNHTNQSNIDYIFRSSFVNYIKYYDTKITSVDIEDLCQTEDIYFCVKRQGSFFGKCFIQGKILISGFNIKDIECKPDRCCYDHYECCLMNIIDDIENKIETIKEDYNSRSYSILKMVTNQFVHIDDIKSGYFYSKIKMQ